MKNYAIIVNTEDDTNIEIVQCERKDALKKFKDEIQNCVNTQSTVGVGLVELNEDGTGKINIGYDISGNGECYTFDVENNYWDDEMTFDEFFENWWDEQFENWWDEQ